MDIKLDELIALIEARNQVKQRQDGPIGQHIAVLDRGFVYVGDCKWVSGDLVIDNAKCIRKWGTTKGLGELRDGPTVNTVCDSAGLVRVPERAIIHLIACKGF